MAKPSFGKKETPLDYGALVKNLRDKGPERLYLLWGEEDYLLTDFVSRLRTACVGTAEDEFNAKRIDSPAPAANDIAEALNAMPFCKNVARVAAMRCLVRCAISVACAPPAFSAKRAC